MKDIHIGEVNNGYTLVFEDETGRKSVYVYKSTELLVMLEAIGKVLNGKRVYIKD